MKNKMGLHKGNSLPFTRSRAGTTVKGSTGAMNMPLGAYPICGRLASMELAMGVQMGERILPLVLMKSSWGCRGELEGYPDWC